MKPKGLLISVVLLAALGGLVWWSNRQQAAASKSSDKTVKLMAIPEDQFQEIQIKKVTGETVTLKRNGNQWGLTQPKTERADQDAAAAVATALSALNADKVLEEKAADLTPYGLKDPTLDVAVTKKDGKKEEILIGDNTPTGSGAYAKLVNDPRVFTISTVTKGSLDKRPDDLRDKRLLTFDSERLSRVELQGKGGTVEFGKNNANEWQIVKPRPLRADSTQVETLVGKLKEAKMDPLNVDPDAAKKFAAGTKVAVVTVTDLNGNQTLEVRKSGKDDYAKSSAIEGVYKIASDLGDALDKGLDDFRNRKVFDFGFSDPTRLEVQGVTYTKNGDKWMSGSKAMENITVQTLIDKLRDLSATKFTDKPGGETVFEATVASNDGKRVEKATIRKQGAEYFAQRENEPSIYEIDPTAAEALKKAAADVKEAAAPAAAKKK